MHDQREFVDALIAILSADARAESDGILDMGSHVDLPAVIVDVIDDAQQRIGSIDGFSERRAGTTVTGAVLVIDDDVLRQKAASAAAEAGPQHIPDVPAAG